MRGRIATAALNLLRQLEREGLVVPAPLGGYWLRERAGIPSPHRLLG